LVVVVDAGLADVEVWGRNPFGDAVADTGGPPRFGEAVVGPAGEDFFVDAGVAVVLPAVGWWTWVPYPGTVQPGLVQPRSLGVTVSVGYWSDLDR
jgi:hypothetical protein